MPSSGYECTFYCYTSYCIYSGCKLLLFLVRLYVCLCLSLCLLPAQALGCANALPVVLLPRLIVFDLDGCLWSPELHDLSRRMRKRDNGTTKTKGQEHAHAADHHGHSPFFTKLTAGNQCRSSCGVVISLYKDVPEILEAIRDQNKNDMQEIMLAISSRTEHSEWARELLDKFDLPGLTSRNKSSNDNHNDTDTTMAPSTGPWIIIDSTRPKVLHFEQLARETGIPYPQMMFFDNHARNCKAVSRLGVTVGYCPKGLDLAMFTKTMSKFPVPWGVVGLQIHKQ